MRCYPWNRLALCGGVLALALPGLIWAQDGKSKAGTPVTNPRTNALKPRADTSTPPPGTSNDALPGVPATPGDPAPPGTRAISPENPAAPTGLPPAEVPGGADAVVPVAPLAARGLRTVEGIVTHISRAAKDVPGELIRLTIDPTKGWDTYATGVAKTRRESRAPRNSARASEDRARVRRDQARLDRDRAAGADEATISGDQAKLSHDKAVADRDANRAGARAPEEEPVDIVFTRQSRLWTFARNADGVDLLGATTASSPDETSSRSGLTRRVGTPTPGPKETNFTNIKEGSYVAVRFRRVGDMNVATNVSLIELPLLDAAENPPGVSSTTGAETTGGIVPGAPSPTTRPGAAVPGIAAPGAPAGPPGPTVPVRTPRVPESPASPGTLPR